MRTRDIIMLLCAMLGGVVVGSKATSRHSQGKVAEAQKKAAEAQKEAEYWEGVCYSTREASSLDMTLAALLAKSPGMQDTLVENLTRGAGGWSGANRTLDAELDLIKYGVSNGVYDVQVHVAKNGDQLNAIAIKYDVPRYEIIRITRICNKGNIKVNGERARVIKNPNRIWRGHPLFIPSYKLNPAKTVTLEKGMVLDKVAGAYLKECGVENPSETEIWRMRMEIILCTRFHGGYSLTIHPEKIPAGSKLYLPELQDHHQHRWRLLKEAG